MLSGLCKTADSSCNIPTVASTTTTSSRKDRLLHGSLQVVSHWMKWSHSYRAYKNAWHCLACHPLIFLSIVVALRGINCKSFLEKMPLSDLIFFMLCSVLREKFLERHPFSLECMNDLKMVYRSPTDITKQRKQSTTCPAGKAWRFHYKMTQMRVKWLESTQWCCLKGCLSDISPSAGTNRNEALHRHLNPHFANRSRIGVPLALTLMAILLFQHNCRIETNSLVNSLWRFNCGDANMASQTLQHLAYRKRIWMLIKFHGLPHHLHIFHPSTL